MATPSTTATPGNDRRRSPRYLMALDALFGPADPGPIAYPPDHLLKRTITVDLSQGGVCLYSDVNIPMGGRVFCAITLPGRQQPIATISSVNWFQKLGQGQDGYKLGLEFLEFSADHREVLHQFLDHPPTTEVSRSRTLLLADDDEQLQHALKLRFESAGFRVIVARDGVEALRRTREEQPHLVILDLMLPRMTGYDVCRLLKFDQKFHHIPIMLFSARARQEDVETGYAVGADAYVTKPCDGRGLIAKAEELLAKHR